MYIEEKKQIQTEEGAILSLIFLNIHHMQKKFEIKFLVRFIFYDELFLRKLNSFDLDSM
jgi:hypothetical protein